MVNEIVTQSLRRLQSLIALRQCSLYIDAIGDVDKGKKCAAIRQRRGGAIDNRAICSRHAPLEAHTSCMKSGDDRTEIAPAGVVLNERTTPLGNEVNMRFLAQLVERQAATFARKTGYKA